MGWDVWNPFFQTSCLSNYVNAHYPFCTSAWGWDTPSRPVICQIMLISVTLSLPHNMWTLSLAHGFYLSVNFREAHTNKVKVIWHTHLVFHRTVTEQ